VLWRNRTQAADWRLAVPNVLEEVTDGNIDRAHVIRRVDDWASRIDRLYAQVEQWLPEGWTADRFGTVRMEEQLMKQFGVEARSLPKLRLSHGGQAVARIEPRVLWIVGTNGRLDLFRENEHFVIIDTADNLEPPKGHIAPFAERHKSQPLNRQTLVAAL
jgi:hypothetical protein